MSQSLTISVLGKQYQLPFVRPYINWVHQRVEVFFRHDGENASVYVVHDDEEIQAPLATPEDVTEAGTYAAVSETDRAEDIDRAASQTFATFNAAAVYGTDEPYIPRQGAPFEDQDIAARLREDGSPSFAADPELTRFAVISLLRQAGQIGMGKLSTDELTMIKSIMQGHATVRRSALDFMLGQLPQSKVEEG